MITEIWRAECEWWEKIALMPRIATLSVGESSLAQWRAEAKWDELMQAAGIDPAEEEAGIATLLEVGAQHNLLHPGDFVVSDGYGGTIVILRDES